MNITLHRGCGVGTKLLEHLLTEIYHIGADCIITDNPANKAAIQLYEKCGFLNKEFIKNYYRENEDRFVFTRYA